jgi:hypothetical protein
VYRPIVATLTTAAFLAAGCAGRAWPARPTTVASAQLAATPAIATVDVLPLDLQLWAQPDYNVDLDDVRAHAERDVMSVVLAELTDRRYTVGATIDWNGAYPGGTALAASDVVATAAALSRYGATAAAHPGALPVPFLPARLGTQTGADATLYVGGWGLVAPHGDGGSNVMTAIVVGLLILTVVAIVALAASDRKGHSHGGGGGGGASSGGGGHGVGVSAGRGVEHLHHAGGGAAAYHVARDMVDAFGRVAVDAAVDSDWSDDPALPHDGDPQLYLEMTLVDNHTGLALWHARQQFPASAESAEDLARAASTMLAQLPSRPAR